MAVHGTLGCGFLEAVYQDALAIEMQERGIPFEEQVLLPVTYRGRRVGAGYKVDFLCYGRLIVEIKAQSALESHAIAQTVHYMRAADQEIGLVFNFGSPSLEFRRLISPAALAAPPPFP